MKLWGIFRFELAYQIRRVWPWLFLVVVLVLSFLLARDNSLADALYEDFFANSSFAVAKTTVIAGLVWLLLAPAIAGEAAARDVATGMHPLAYTVPISKAEYLGGRFLAAFVLNAVLLIVVQAGILLGVYSPGVNAAVLGPFRPAVFLTAYAFISLPNALTATTIQFSLALRSGRAMSAYLGSLFLVFMGFFVASFVNFFVKRGLGSLLDPVGINYIVEDLAHEWTTIEKSTRLLALEGGLLANRIVWLAVALAVIALTYLRFRFAHRTQSSWWRRMTRRANAHAPAPAVIGITATAHISVPQIPRAFNFRFHVRQTVSIGWNSFRTLAKSWAGLGLLVGIPALTVLVIIDQLWLNGVPMIPTTARVLRELTGPLSAEMSRWVIIPLIIVFFAGELVWREREAGLGEITDAIPGSEWAPLLGKFLGLSGVLAASMAVLTAAGMVVQTLLDYHNFEIPLYLKILFGLQLPEYLLFAVLALAVHVVINQKYIAHLVAILIYVVILLSSMFGIEHNLLVYGGSPGWSYTIMRRFGPFIGPWLWFKLYWAAWALLLAVLARLLWVRGRETKLRVRVESARRRFAGPTLRAGAFAAGLILALGGFIFYNTNILNEYQSTSTNEDRRAEYERRYSRYANIPQPQLTGTTLQVDIFPERREARIRGSHRLVNRGTAQIDSIHVATVPGLDTMAFDRAAVPVVADDDLRYRIYSLEKPLQPSDSLRLDFEVRLDQRGFGNRGVDASVVANGSYFTSKDWLPAIGYQRLRELLAPTARRKRGLPARPMLAALADIDASQDLSRSRGAVIVDAILSTDKNQIAVAPGVLRRTWTENGRSYFHYSTDTPISNAYQFFSAHYAVHTERWNNVAIQIFYHPAHAEHVDRMLRSIRASLDYYTKNFGPYAFDYLTFVERPGIGTGMHAEPGMVTYPEGFALWKPRNDQGLDMPFAVVAHEMGHQWGMSYAYAEGLPFLSEGLAWYFGMQVMEEARGPDQLQKLLTFMHQPYPHRPIRRGEPLLRALDPYMSYRKGPLAMYLLTQYMGKDRVNGAIRRLVEKDRSGKFPQATTLDLYRELQAVAPDSVKPLLHDLFEVNVYWQLKVERITAVQAGGGTWQVTLDVGAHKMMYDRAGVETELPMNELVDIGVFDSPEKERGELSAPLYLEKHRIRSGEQTITVTVPQKPVLAGIDPHHVLDWEQREEDDNIARVQIKSR